VAPARISHSHLCIREFATLALLIDKLIVAKLNNSTASRFVSTLKLTGYLKRDLAVKAVPS
jgi:DNA-binding IclR family transcriptional regulator